jgi:hypothetical protein
MGRISITEKGKPVTCQADWPLFYMNDFSRLGLVVTRLGETVAALQANGYTVHENEQGCLLEVNDREQLAGAFNVLSARHLEYEVADLVSCVYQG